MIVFSILRVLGLRLMGKAWGVWIDKWALATVVALLAAGGALVVAQLARHGSTPTVTQAVTQAVAQRDAIQAEHDKQEVVDDGFVRGYLQQLAGWRREAAAADAGRADVVIDDDDPWLRAKRSGGR